MGGSAAGNISNSRSQNSTSFNQRIDPTQLAALKQLWGSLPGVFNQVAGLQNSLIPGAVGGLQNVPGQVTPAWNTQLGGGVYADAGLKDKLMSSLDQSLSGPTATQEINNLIMGGKGNNYADAMKQQYVQDANDATDNMLANLDARAAASDLSGGSRHGVATSLGMRDINKNLQRNLAETGYNTFDKDLERKLQIAGQADQGTLARQGMMSGMLDKVNQAQQGAMNFGSTIQDLIMNQFQPTMMPWQNASSWSNTIGDPTVLSRGNSQGSSSAKSVSQQAGGGVGGSK